jgi:hypothetical protein
MMEQSVEAFWENFEKETGEKVLMKTMSQRFASSKDRGDWGLLVLSPSVLRFRKTPGENWFSSLFRASSPSVPGKSEEDLVIPFSSIASISTPPKKFLDFLFGSPFQNFKVEFTKNEARENVRFAVDPKNNFVARLKELAKLP